MYTRVRVCVNVERAHVTSACCYLEITARKCRSFEEEEKGIEFDASMKKKLSSFRGLPFPSLRELVVVSWWFPWSCGRWLAHFAARVLGKIKKNLCVVLLLHATCALLVCCAYACNIHT